MTNTTRRRIVAAACALPFAAFLRADAESVTESTPIARLAALETNFPGRLGVYAFRNGGPASLGYHATQRFPMCSTAKLLIVGAVMHRSQSEPALLDKTIAYSADALVTYSPVTEKHVGAGMSVRDLCAAAMTVSDNTAANLLVRHLGGPGAVNAFARALQDQEFRLDRWETALNSAIPGDPRDTTTPEAMAHTLQRLALGEGLAPQERQHLQDWLRSNTTGATRIRAGLPKGWVVGDKTGTGGYGSTNDIGIVWPANGTPIVIAIYTTQHNEDAESRADVVAAATRIVVDWASGNA